MQKAAKEAIFDNNSDNNIAVAVAGTWQKRGYTSHNGVVTVTGVDTGKLYNGDERCVQNIFKRSLTFQNACYTKYLGDGDSKAFDAITEENIYGDEFQVEKLECIGHVMKRMGSRLRRLKEKMKGQLLSDGKRISENNRLTDSQIDKIQNYYA
ncbi:hypothetical protein AVEN_252950-1 [Araneus ventricosus]|uniref:Mutator-like transposase domain-containing protein n=1 Tax=Araneus ventricosus TaxID=182803 RepID=A0A4Y2UC97_ARAVE|nr:hypothetical protein AVEN_252950-1 [Araneus ventricosus]